MVHHTYYMCAQKHILYILCIADHIAVFMQFLQNCGLKNHNNNKKTRKTSFFPLLSFLAFRWAGWLAQKKCFFLCSTNCTVLKYAPYFMACSRYFRHTLLSTKKSKNLL